MITITTLASSSRGNCYHVTDGSTPLLLECGISWKDIQRKLNFETHKIDSCLISHSHNDHSAYVKDVIKAGIDCYMSGPTAEAIGVSGHRIKIIEPKKKFVVGTWAVLPFETQHDCPGAMGYLLVNRLNERLLFATDTYYIKYCFSGLNIIAVECNYSLDILKANVEAGKVPVAMKNRLLHSHFSLDNVKEFLKANDLSKVSEIHLLHLSDGNSDAERFRREIQELTGKMVYVAEK